VVLFLLSLSRGGAGILGARLLRKALGTSAESDQSAYLRPMPRSSLRLLAAAVLLSACNTSTQPAAQPCPQCPVCPEVAPTTTSARAAPSQGIAPVPLDTPKASPGADDATLVVSITRDGKLFLGHRAVPDLAALTSDLREVATKNPEVRVSIQADKEVTHGRVIGAIDAIKQAGVSKLGFATAPPSAPPKPQ
jgi:biopolymer transport protein ExbD